MISPMATQLNHSQFFLPSYKLLFAVGPESRLCQFRLLHGRNVLTGVCASSPNKTSVAGSGRKPTKTNADLCNDLHEFMAEIGLPDGHVPSLKELTQHGRHDLANVVRRRGYKHVRELLAASQEIKAAGSDVQESFTEDKTSNNEDKSAGQNENENEKELTGNFLLSHEDTITEETFCTNTFDNDTESNVESCFSVDESTKSSLQEKVARFIQSGELEAIEDDDLNVVNAKESSGPLNSVETELSSVSAEESSQVVCVSDSINLANGSILRNITSNNQLACVESINTDNDEKVEIRTEDEQAEINRIKVMLHHKELELSQLKEQIEKNKQALSELQAKAETEISKAQKLLLDKEAELVAAEEQLSGLKQVEVEYWGEGETVQVAGSFNGWHQGVTLDPQPSSNITDPVELRNSRLWKSMLWLYPGIYEIKFIIDGNWIIDPMREVITRGSIHNNVLRVDR